jgi:hypothetical protein
MTNGVPVEIAGKTFTLRYTLSTRPAIESKCGGRGLWDIMFSGALLDMATVIWAGLHGHNKTISNSPHSVVDLLEKHQEKGGNYDDVAKVAYRAVIDNRLLGKVDQREVDRVFKLMWPEDPEDEPTGKDERPATVRAAE